MPAAIASSPRPSAAKLSTIAGGTARLPDTRMHSTTPNTSPMASIGPHPTAYITAVMLNVCTPTRADRRQPS